MADSPSTLLTLSERTRRAVVRARFRFYNYARVTSAWLTARRRKHAGRIEFVLWAVVSGAAFLSSGILQSQLSGILDGPGVSALREFVSTVGGAMIGATAIASSFILFALQVNVERLPLGLFRHFSSDKKLVASVAASILLAVGGTALSLITDANHVGTIVLAGTLALALILRLLFYAYQRSLRLIDPAEQLTLVYSRMARNLRRWGRRVDALATLVDVDDEASAAREENRFDTRRAVILQGNPGWANGVKAAVAQTVAYARRAGESGDLEVSGFALSLLVKLNVAYITARGRTFFANQLLLDNPLVSDVIFNETLESLKRLRGAALGRRDELQLEQIFDTKAALINVLCEIEYGRINDSKSHALLAAGYLESAVEAVVPSGMTDTVMRGIQAMGRSATSFVASSAATDATGLIKKIAIVGSVGAISPDQRPITLIAMEELRNITLNIIRSEEHDPGFAFSQLRQSVSLLTQTFLQLPDAILGGHSTYLAPYYSVTSGNSLAVSLTQLANAIVECRADDPVAARVANHLEIWANQIYISQKELLLLSVEKHSPFFFDIAHWITQVSEVLLVVASAAATRDHTRGELRKHALWLASTLSWLPTDVETAKFVEGWSHRDNLVDLALRCRRHDETKTYEAVRQMMLDWALKAGANHTGWDTLSRWLLALAGLAMTASDDNEQVWLKDRLTANLDKDGSPNQEMRDGAARRLREASQDVRQREFEVDRVKQLLAHSDVIAVWKFLIDLANILSPATRDEPVQPFF